MKVKIRYCGQLKQAAGCPAEELEPDDGLSAQELIASVAASHGEPLSGYLLDESGRLRATVLAFVVGAQEAAKRMEKVGGGAIISLSSTGNLVYTPNYAGHGSSKAAVETMVKYAAHELGPKNIRVNAVSGGPIDTDALRAFPNYEEVKAETIARSPLGRMGTPEDLAGACWFLCSDEAGWITGQTLVVDGGTSFS